MPETLYILGRERTREQRNRDAVPGTEGPGGAAPSGARLPPLARSRADGAESHGEHQCPPAAMRRPSSGAS